MKIFTGHRITSDGHCLHPCVKLVHGRKVVSVVPADLGYSDFSHLCESPDRILVAQMDSRQMRCYIFPTEKDAEALWVNPERFEVEKTSLKTMQLAIAWLLDWPL